MPDDYFATAPAQEVSAPAAWGVEPATNRSAGVGGWVQFPLSPSLTHRQVFALRAAHLRNPVATAEIINGVYGLTLQILNHDLEKAAKLLEKRLATGDDSPWHAELSFTSYIAAAYYALLCCFFNRLPAPFSLKALVLAWDDSTKAKAEYRGVNVLDFLYVNCTKMLLSSS